MNKSKYRFIPLVAAAFIISGCSDSSDIQLEQSIQGIYDGALSSDGKYSLIASIHHGASLWRLEDQERIYNWNHTPGEYSQISHVGISENGYIGMTAFEQQLVAWDEKTGQHLEFWQLPAVISCIDLNYDGTYALIGMDSGQAMIIDVNNKGFSWLQTFPEKITACDMTSKANAIAVGTLAGGVYSYQIKKSRADESVPFELDLELILAFHHDYGISHVNLLPRQLSLLSASRHHEMLITDIKSKQNLYIDELKDSSITQTIETDTHIIIAKTNRTIDFLNSQTFEVEKTITVPKRNKWKASGIYIADIAFNQNTLVVTGTDGMTHFYNNVLD